jgi:hypothetical protein
MRWLAVLGLLLACSCWYTAFALFGIVIGERIFGDPFEQARIAASKQLWTSALIGSLLGGMMASSAIAGFTLRSNRVLAASTFFILAAFVAFVVCAFFWNS